MKIELIAAPFVEVPPKKYGGHERILDYLGRSLHTLGQDVTLYASGDSDTSIPKKPICEIALFNDPSYDHSADRERKIGEVNERTLDLLNRNAEIVNCHDYDNPDLIERLSKTGMPVVVSIGHAITPLIRRIYERFKDNSNINFHGLSQSQLGSLDETLHYIHNGIDPDLYEAVTLGEKRDYFFSIGDMKPIKGHKTAIKLARASKLDLVIAGAPFYPESKPYFENEVLPNIDVDVSHNTEEFLNDVQKGNYPFKNGEIVYFGPASDGEKKILFKHARFAQFLGNLEVKGNIEASPLTPLESILSGTPVLGVKESVTEEIIRQGITGLNIVSLEEAVERVRDLFKLDPKTIRQFGIKENSTEAMAINYLDFYKKITSGALV